jgi:phospholipase/carboxylesterase
MPLKTLDFSPGDTPAATVIVMHGLGASPTDFLSFVSSMDLAAVGPVRWVFPAAPIQPVTINGGMEMPSWYDIRGMDIVSKQDEAGLRASAAEVQAVIDREIALGVPASRIVLGGFSQGGVMALLAGVRAPRRLAGLLDMSGYLALAPATAAERSEANRDVPIFMGHGRQDGVVPIAAGLASRDTLVGLGYAVEWHDYPIQHGVSPEEERDINAWLLKVLAPKA